MFSVPGWNVSAPLATQVEKARPKDNAGQGKKSQKRKQQRDAKQQAQIDEGNLGKMWETIVEGKGDVDVGAMQNATGVNSGKLGKKRKRNNDKEAREESQAGTEGAGNEAKEEVDASEQSKLRDVGKEAASEAPSKREKKKRKKDHKADSDANQSNAKDDTTKSAPAASDTLPPLIPEPKNLTPLQKSMRAKLTSARFRHLNESLYTKPSAESLEIFKENPDMFLDYHRGFAQQVEVWPENPVDGYVDAILTRGKARTKDPWKDKRRQEKKNKKGGNKLEEDTALANVKPLPRNMKGHATIADLGCGTASLSYRLQSSLKPLNLTLHSFDLSKPTGPTADLVTVADISALPLPDSSIDVAIFCLALMGTNWLDFIDEAWRILRWRGELWVSEIKSRFGRVGKSKVPINSIGSLRKTEKKKPTKKGGKKDDDVAEGPQNSDDEQELATRVDGVEGRQEGTDVSAFVAVLRSRGFVLDAPPERPNDAVDMSNKMFVKMQFVKAVPPTKGKNVRAEDLAKEKEKGANQMRMGIKGKKFAAVGGEDEEGGDEVDAKVLKPCLYKIR
jgi:ribosomal RNA-processing protein 8